VHQLCAYCSQSSWLAHCTNITGIGTRTIVHPLSCGGITDRSANPTSCPQRPDAACWVRFRHDPRSICKRTPRPRTNLQDSPNQQGRYHASVPLPMNAAKHALNPAAVSPRPRRRLPMRGNCTSQPVHRSTSPAHGVSGTPTEPSAQACNSSLLRSAPPPPPYPAPNTVETTVHACTAQHMPGVSEAH
jgi:hypothetical protein